MCIIQFNSGNVLHLEVIYSAKLELIFITRACCLVMIELIIKIKLLRQAVASQTERIIKDFTGWSFHK
jgi:hypothetical protein